LELFLAYTPSNLFPLRTYIFSSDVCTKYQEAAKIVNLALQGLVQQCVPGAKVIDLCEFGHSILNASAAKLYTKKSNGAVMDRGVAFPVCVSVNDVVCNDSPLLSEERVRGKRKRMDLSSLCV
jgi:methionine aminopeptidase